MEACTCVYLWKPWWRHIYHAIQIEIPWHWLIFDRVLPLSSAWLGGKHVQLCSRHCVCWWPLRFFHYKAYDDLDNDIITRIIMMSVSCEDDVDRVSTHEGCRYGPLPRYAKSRVAIALGNALRVSEPDIHHGTCVMHVLVMHAGIAN